MLTFGDIFNGSGLRTFQDIQADYSCQVPPLLEVTCTQCWEGYFENVIGYRLQVTLFKM